MANARSLGYLHQRMLERAEDAAAALRAAIGPTTTDLATLQQQSSGANNIGLHSHHHDEDEDDDSDDASLDDLDETDRRKSSTKKAAATNPYLAGILTSLDSSSDEARIDGLRRIIAAIAAGRYRIAHAALPAVLKLTSSSITSLHVRKLVSIILARSASAQPDLALLAVNSFQRDLSHHSPLIRASALKALGSLRIPVLAPILRLAIASAARDSNSHVRRIAALSLSKAYALDTSALPELVSLLALLFNDRSPSVLGAALVAYSSLGYPPPETAAVSAGTSAYNYDDGSNNHPPTSTPTDHENEDDQEKKGSRDQYALLHPYFRKLCHALADMDEWAQSHALDVLLLYARANFSQPSGPSHQQGSSSSSNNAPFPPKGKEREKQDIDAFFADDEPPASATVPSSVGASASSGGGVSPGINEKGPARRSSDLDLLLSKAQPLLMSRNPAVVLSVVKLTLYLSPPPSSNAPPPPPTYTQTLIRPLLRYVRPSSSPSTTSNTPEVAYIALINLTYLITSFPALLPSLQPHLPAFLPRSASAEEPLYLSLAKVDVLVELCRENVVGARWVLDELEWLAKTADAASGNLGNLMEGEEEKEEEEEEGGGRLARRAVEAIGEVVERVRGDMTEKKKETQDRAEEEDLSQRALDILLRLIRGSSSSPTSRTMTTTTKTLGGKKNAGGMNKSVGEGGVQGGVVARAISVLRTLLQWRAPPVSLVPPTTGSTEQPASADELSTGRILANFPTLLFGPPSLTPSSATTTTSVNAEGKTVQIIRRPKVLGRNAIRDPEARANLFWLLGQHCRTRVAITLPSQQGQSYKTLAELVGPDLLRRAALNFANESCGTKLQILTYATKLGTFLPTVGGGVEEVVVGLVGYVMQLGRYDADYDVRDRARFCKALTRGLSPAPTVEKVSGDGEEGGEKEEEEEEDEEEEEEEEEVGGVKLRREQVLMILFEGKDFSPPEVHPPSTQQGGQEPNIFGTLALALSSSSRPGGTRKTRFLLRGSQKMALPRWASPEEATPSSVRDAVSNSSSSSSPAAAVAVAAAVSQSSAPLPPRAVADSAPAIGAQAERAVEALASRAAKRLSSSSTSGGGAHPTSHPVVGMAAPLVHASSSSGVDARYKDLEDFLDDEDMEEVEVELDEDAPEDGEYEEEEEEEEEEVGGSHSRMLSGSESNAWAS
ncbi:hypothetical protein A4X13_0g5194 [Tilletia indica]|uniref:Clathrin/coatomer adaptor adaptin-like N-terminal domain-containing protein n=1 Tax=Tilletia indica TaxID=43049 RepID=A0A177TYB1_9BASI|nr:hypothetical protein A4X13_0g5194 [Tilletia indica]